VTCDDANSQRFLKILFNAVTCDYVVGNAVTCDYARFTDLTKAIFPIIVVLARQSTAPGSGREPGALGI